MTGEFDKRKSGVGYLICLLAFVFIIWSFYPGLMTADSLANLVQGRHDYYSDINAPLMSWVWGRLDSIVPGPALLFVIHLAIFWGACALFWYSTNAKSFWLGFALVVFGFAPHLLAQTVVVWKDVALGVSLFMAVALVYFARTTGRRFGLLVSPLFLFYAYAARLNALPAILPVAFWSALVAVELFKLRIRRPTAILLAAAYLASLSLGVTIVNACLTQRLSDYPFQQVLLYDLTAISIERNESLFPDHVRSSDFSLDLIKVRYNERSVSDLIYADVPNKGDFPPFLLSRDPEEISVLRRHWIDAVSSNPGAYLRHRGRVFTQLVGLSRSVTAPYVATGFAGNLPEFRGSENFGYRTLMAYFGAFRRPAAQTVFFRAVIWMVVCVILVWLALRRRLRRDWDMVFVLASSSLLFVFAYFPTTPSTEFRYLFWPAIASAVATIFGVYLWWNERAGRGSRESLNSETVI